MTYSIRVMQSNEFFTLQSKITEAEISKEFESIKSFYNLNKEEIRIRLEK